MAANYNNNRSRMIYELVVRQEPKQARMCGVGGKADRRPIDPPPIVQLRVIDPTLQSGSSTSGPSRTRRDSNGDSTSSSPGPRPYSDDASDASPYAQSFLQNPYYFMFASLARPDDETELHWLKDGRTRCTTGSVVSSLYHLKDPHNNNEDAGFFVFPDLSVRTEGSYRLKLSLFEVVDNNVHHCKSIYSAPFYVYTAKKFPGMEESTPLSCSLADQGIKIRIRKDIRVRKRPIPALSQPLPMTIDGEESDGDDDEEEEDTGRQQKKRRETKRSRLDDSADASGSGMVATNQQQLPWPPVASLNPSLGPTIPPPPAAPPNSLPSSSVVIPPPPKPGKETPPVNGIAMGVHVPPGSTLPGPSVFDGRGGGLISFQPPQQPAVASESQPPAAHTTSSPTVQYRDPSHSDEATSPQAMTPPQMTPPIQQAQQPQQQPQYAPPPVTPTVAPMPPQQFQTHQQSATVASPATLPPQPVPPPPQTHVPPPPIQHQPPQHMQHPQPTTSYPPAPYSQWNPPPMPPGQPSVYDPYYHHPQHPHYAAYAPQQAMPPPPPPPPPAGRYDYTMYGHGQPTMGGYGYYDQHQQHHPHPQAQMMQPPPHPYTQHQMHAPPPVPQQFAPPPMTNAPPSTVPTSAGGTTHPTSEVSQTNGINGSGSPGSLPPSGYASAGTPVSATQPISATTAPMAAAPNGGYDYAATPVYNNRPHAEATTAARPAYVPPPTPVPAPYGIHPTQPAPPPPHPQAYSMHAAAGPGPPPPHPSHVSPMRPYAPPPHPHAPPPHPSYSYVPYSAPPPPHPAPEWNTQPFVNTVATHQHAWEAYGHHTHQPQHHGGVAQSVSHTQTSPVTGAVNPRTQLAPLIPASNGTHSGTGPSHGANGSGNSPTIHSPTRTVNSAASSPTTLRSGGRVSMSSSGRDRGGGDEGGHGYQNQGHVQGKKNPLSIGSIISEDVR